MHGARRVATFCLLTAVVPTILIIIPLYLRHSLFADVVYQVAESDVFEIREGISSIFCQQHVLNMNSSFSAYQLNKLPEVSKNRKHIRLKKSMRLPDDTLEYWGFYLLNGATVQLRACSRFEGGRILVVRGERNLRTCGLLEHNQQKIGLDKEYKQVQITFEAAAQEVIVGKDDVDLNTAEEDTSDTDVPSNVNAVREGAKNAVGEDTKKNKTEKHSKRHERKRLEDITKLREELDELRIDKRRKREDADIPNNVNDVKEDTSNAVKEDTNNYAKDTNNVVKEDANNSVEDTNNTVKEDTNKNETEKHSKRHERKRLEDKMKLQEELDVIHINKRRKREDTDIPNAVKEDTNNAVKDTNNAVKDTDNAVKDTNNAVKEDTNKNKTKKRSERHERKRLEDIMKLREELDDEIHINKRRKRETGHKLDGAIGHGGNALNHTEVPSLESSISSFENNLLTCYDGQILVTQAFPPSHLCTDVTYVDDGVRMRMTHEVNSDGYYYYIFYSDNDLVSNDIHAIFDIYKPTFQYTNASETKQCVNKTLCTFNVSFFSGETVIVEVPTRDGIEHEPDDITQLVSICKPRVVIYMIFPITILFLILGCAFL